MESHGWSPQKTRVAGAFGLFLVSVVAGGPLPASAMGIRTERTVIAKGRDGSQLVEVRSYGPEGGGSLAYSFVERPDPASPRGIDYVLSSDFSPGGSTRPQTVSSVLCHQRLEAISTQVAARGYPDVSVNAKPCDDNKHRSGFIAVKGQVR